VYRNPCLLDRNLNHNRLRRNLARVTPHRPISEPDVHMAQNSICVPPPVNHYCAARVVSARSVRRRAASPAAPAVQRWEVGRVPVASRSLICVSGPACPTWTTTVRPFTRRWGGRPPAASPPRRPRGASSGSQMFSQVRQARESGQRAREGSSHVAPLYTPATLAIRFRPRPLWPHR